MSLVSDITVTVGGSPMTVLVARPPVPTPCPAVVLTHHRGGIDEFTQRTAERLAANGFIAAAPRFYHRRPAGEDTAVSRQSLNDAEVVADIAAVVDHLRADRSVRAAALAIMGHCAGGRMAFLGAASNPHFKAAVVFYGGNIFKGEGAGRPPPIELAGNIRGAMLGLFGKEDTNPSPADVAAIDAELTRLGIRHQFHSYDGAGHAFQNFTDKTRYRQAVAEDAWAKALAFLKGELRS